MNGSTTVSVIFTAVLMLNISACAIPETVTPSVASIPETLIDPELIVEAQLSRELMQSLVVQVTTESRHDNWLLLGGYVEKPDGRSLDYAQTPYKRAIDDGVFENTFVALFRQAVTTQGYKLLELTFGDTDSPVDQWQLRHALPDELLRGQGSSGSDSLQWQ